MKSEYLVEVKPENNEEHKLEEECVGSNEFIYKNCGECEISLR